MDEIVSFDKIENRQELVDLIRDPRLGKGISVVYVFYLSKEFISYPKGKSNILYIGEAKQDKYPTGNRFGKHISETQIKGADTNTNLTLSQYFYENWDIGLKIFKVDNRKDKERDLIYAHISNFGSKPIAQGAVPHDDSGKNRLTHIYDYITKNSERLNDSFKVLRSINKIQA